MSATCPNCGAVAAPDEDRCASCSLPLRVACPNCGAHVPADEEECPACDAPLSHAADV